MGKAKYIAIGFLTLLFILIVGCVAVISTSHQTYLPKDTTAIQKETPKPEYVTYSGETGKTAQELLMRKETNVKLDASGMVSTINNRLADPNKHEYWAFYVNGKMSSVGAGTYVTQDTDKIEWTIEKY